MTDISKIEERLFLLLDTVEKQAEENAQQQKIIAELTAKLDKKTDSIDAKINRKIEDAENTIELTQKRFDNIVYLSTKHVIEQNLPTLLENVIRENADFEPIENALDRAVESLNEQINGNSSLYKTIHKYNMETINDTADALAHQKDAVMKDHFKLLAIVSSGVFIIFFLFFWIMYTVTVPSPSRLESLKQEKIQLMRDINQLKRNRGEWIKDASKNGYLNR